VGLASEEINFNGDSGIYGYDHFAFEEKRENKLRDLKRADSSKGYIRLPLYVRLASLVHMCFHDYIVQHGKSGHLHLYISKHLAVVHTSSFLIPKK